jgi:hypothetical protein
MKSILATIIACVAALACEKATPNRTVFTKVNDRIVRLASGDSIEWQLTLPMSVDGRPPGLLVEFYPFRSMVDTVALRSIALDLFPIALRELGSRNPAFIVVRAVSLPARDRKGRYYMQNYGFAFDHRSDGRWYRLRDSVPLT